MSQHESSGCPAVMRHCAKARASDMGRKCCVFATSGRSRFSQPRPRERIRRAPVPVDQPIPRRADRRLQRNSNPCCRLGFTPRTSSVDAGASPAQPTQPLQGLDDPGLVPDHGALGDLDLEKLRIEGRVAERPLDRLHEAALPQLMARDVDRDPERGKARVAPGPDLGARRYQHPLAQGYDQAGSLVHRLVEELVVDGVPALQSRVLQSAVAVADARCMPREARREPRFDTKLWVGIPEAEGEAELETCNVSASGMLVCTPRDAGRLGAVRMLRLVTADLGASIEVMSHVVRVITREDSEQGERVLATAFEFLPHNPDELVAFLGEVLDGEVTIVPDRRMADRRKPAADLPEGQAASGALNVSRVVLDTNFAIEAGTRICVEIETHGSGDPVRLEGQAVESRRMKDTEEDELYCVEVALGDELQNQPPVERRASKPTVSDEGAHHEKDGTHLSGSLSEVALPSLLGFFELERASGVLRLEQESMTAAVFVKDGFILDVESEPPGTSPTDVLADLLKWPDGAFQFTFEAVERADAIGMGTTALLLDCARRSDENARLS